jgi:hypothetical protein
MEIVRKLKRLLSTFKERSRATSYTTWLSHGESPDEPDDRRTSPRDSGTEHASRVPFPRGVQKSPSLSDLSFQGAATDPSRAPGLAGLDLSWVQQISGYEPHSVFAGVSPSTTELWVERVAILRSERDPELPFESF